MTESLYWLTRHWKQYPQPAVVYDSKLAYEGCYQWPTCAVLRIGNQPIDARNGVIVLAPEDSLADDVTLAHEYRHHLQALHWGVWQVGDAGRNYYRTCPYEHDAIAFSHVMASADEEDMWQEWLDIDPPRVTRQQGLMSWTNATGYKQWINHQIPLPLAPNQVTYPVLAFL